MADSSDHTDRNARLRETLEDLRDDPDALIEIILRQAEQIRELSARVEELEQKVRDLSSETERLRDEAERAGKRQAAPFRVEDEERSEDPDLPGRDEGHEASYRREPEQIDRRVEASMDGCPECREPVTEVRPIRQVVEELPPTRLEVVEVTTYRGECEECGPVDTNCELSMCISALIRPRRDDPPVVPTSKWRQILQFSFHLLSASGTQSLYNDSAQMV